MDAIPRVVLLLVGSGMLLLSVSTALGSLCKVAAWHRTTGRVVGHRKIEGCYVPRVEFLSADGATLTFRSGTGRGVRDYANGAIVKVLYNPKDPTKAEIDTFMRLWFFPLVMAAGAALFIGGALATWGERGHS